RGRRRPAHGVARRHPDADPGARERAAVGRASRTPRHLRQRSHPRVAARSGDRITRRSHVPGRKPSERDPRRTLSLPPIRGSDLHLRGRRLRPHRAHRIEDARLETAIRHVEPGAYTVATTEGWLSLDAALSIYAPAGTLLARESRTYTESDIAPMTDA